MLDEFCLFLFRIKLTIGDFMSTKTKSTMYIILLYFSSPRTHTHKNIILFPFILRMSSCPCGVDFVGYIHPLLKVNFEL